MMTYFKSKALLTIDTNYSFHIKAIQFVKPIIWDHITSLVMDSLGGNDTHTHTHTHTHAHTHTHTHIHKLQMHTDFANNNNYKKPGMH